jgi:hypothetical protein
MIRPPSARMQQQEQQAQMAKTMKMHRYIGANDISANRRLSLSCGEHPYLLK